MVKWGQFNAVSKQKTFAVSGPHAHRIGSMKPVSYLPGQFHRNPESRKREFRGQDAREYAQAF